VELTTATNANRKAASEPFLLLHRDWTLFAILDPSVLVYAFLK